MKIHGHYKLVKAANRPAPGRKQAPKRDNSTRGDNSTDLKIYYCLLAFAAFLIFLSIVGGRFFK